MKVISEVRRSPLRGVAWFTTLALAPLGALSACSGDDGRDGPPLERDDASQAALPEAGSTTDGAFPDARGVFDPKDEPVTCDASPCVTQIVAGDDHFCARLSDGTVRCWGDDSRGQRGIDSSDAEDTDAGKPGVIDLSRVTQISAAGATTCARVDDGGVLCWGGNEHAQLGRELDPPFDEEPHPIPERVAVEPVERVDVGQRSVCVTTAAGSVSCWGNDESAQLARGEPSGPGIAPGPAELGGVVVRRTAAGLDTAFAIDDSGAVHSLGAVGGMLGVLGGRPSSISPNPQAGLVQDLSAVTSFAVSGPTPGLPPLNGFPDEPGPANQHACAISGGDVYCWGKSERGALGSGLPDPVLPRPTFARLGTSAYAQQVAAGGETTCVRLTDGNVACTGENELGQLGIGKAGPFASAFMTAITLQGRAVQVAVAKTTVCALLQGGTVACWGGNLHGELGLGSRDDEPHPSATRVPL